ncbi:MULTISPECIES: hypothetical protein [unclassified Caballeronia]|uniref:hypothetical protein n=1 Tax=unclassified Caballeronia TaxID=2646786 RepID=UPI00025BC30E|nr:MULTISPECIES: hypothetical protein [unclassified Caballeronia]EKS70223.1 hypothetical protein BURK_019155 [Burkholderia sp. SJ98]MCE4546513.1 hypothetical protein [Caballeronia sp. PC1]MCE4573014.1 hypothetical protein [Caballeronia sp. CLC5]
MKRFVLLFIGDGEKPAGDVKRIMALPDIKVIDAGNASMMVVEGPVDVQRKVNRMANWIASEQTVIPSPQPHRYF